MNSEERPSFSLNVGQQEISVDVELLPAEQVPQSQRTATNVARVDIGGREFFAVVGHARAESVDLVVRMRAEPVGTVDRVRAESTEAVAHARADAVNLVAHARADAVAIVAHARAEAVAMLAHARAETVAAVAHARAESVAETMNVVMRITPSEAERNAGVFSKATLDKAAHCVRTEGCLILEDIVNPALVIEARDTFVRKYDRYLDGRNHDDALEVGDRRQMITLDLEPPFDQRELVANSWLCPVLSAAFEGDFVLGAYGVVCSLPAAQRQHIHQDGGDLFPQAALNRMVPTAAITVAIPLLEMNEIHGTTALWPGSHHVDTLGSAEVGEEPLVREGSCVIWDYRLRHAGTPNRSPVPRPLLYMTYCRPWFVDHKNYRQQVPVRAPKGFLTGLPDDLRGLLVRAQEC